jgi:hypothetical protein
LQRGLNKKRRSLGCGSSSPATSSPRPERRWMVASGSRSDRALCEDARRPSTCSVRSHFSNAQRPTSNLPAQYGRLDARFLIWPAIQRSLASVSGSWTKASTTRPIWRTNRRLETRRAQRSPDSCQDSRSQCKPRASVSEARSKLRPCRSMLRRHEVGRQWREHDHRKHYHRRNLPERGGQRLRLSRSPRKWW